jgi:hypothetical protein
VVAGLMAGAITTGLHSLLLEPLIERAIELEEHASQAHGTPSEDPIVDRPTQRWGLVLGFLLYGAMRGLLFGLVVYFGQSLRPGDMDDDAVRRFPGAAGGGSVALLPFLKFPANPPGVGSAESIGYRQWLYVGFLGLGLFWAILGVTFGWLVRDVSAPSPVGRELR